MYIIYIHEVLLQCCCISNEVMIKRAFILNLRISDYQILVYIVYYIFFIFNINFNESNGSLEVTYSCLFYYFIRIEILCLLMFYFF